MITPPPQDACILLVDDEPKNIQLLAALLQEQGYAFEFATNGTEALHWVTTRSFDLILLDIMMPDMDGYEVCRRLKDNPTTRDIPVIFLTARTDMKSVVEGFTSGAVDYIAKPFKREELLVRVKTHVALVQQQHALDQYAALVEEKNFELQKKNAQLKELNASKDTFFSIIAHDLKSPLSSILLFADMLETLEPQQYNRVQEIGAQICKSANNMASLLENLLTWARIQRGMIDYNPKPLNIKHIIEWNINLLQPTATQKEIAFQHTPLTDLQVLADLDMLNTVMRNLLSNAVKFTNTGGLITVLAVPEGEMVKIAVSDTGIGIPPQKLSRLFHGGTKDQQRGTAGERGSGLGLLLCKEFIEKHGGAIDVESTVNKGTTISFCLPGARENS